jgi:hypothetical protein
MAEFRARQVRREGRQVNPAPPERVFPLLCPVREAEWVPGWEYELIHSRSGFAELDCLFTTPNPDGPPTVWQCVAYQPPRRIEYLWGRPGLVTAHLTIELAPAGDGETAASIAYVYTGLSEEGNALLATYDEDFFRAKMQGWEKAINHYLATGKKVSGGEWE